jgi:hypothetical protein
MVCLYSTYEDGATPVASGFTARGTWSSAASYVANDIVSVTGSGTYVAIQASTNEDPTTATAYWMYLEGISASALPVQAGNAGKYLTTDGTNASWGTVDVAGGSTETTMTSDLTLTSASTRYHKIICTTSALSINLPNATSLNEGESFHFIGYNLQEVVIKDSAGGLVTVLKIGSKRTLQLIDNSTAAGTWTCENTSLQAGYTKESTLTIGNDVNTTTGKVAIAEVDDNIVVTATCSPLGVMHFHAINTVSMTKGTSATVMTTGGNTERGNPDLCKIDTNKFACAYSFHDGIRFTVRTVIGTVDANQNVTLGTPYSWGSTFYNVNDPYSIFIRNAGTNKYFAGSTARPSSNWQVYCVAATVSGTTPTHGSPVGTYHFNHVDAWCMKRSDTEFHVFETDGGTGTFWVNKYTMSGTSLSHTQYSQSWNVYREANYVVPMDSSFNRHAVLQRNKLTMFNYQSGQYNSLGADAAISNFTIGGSQAIVRISDDTVGLIGVASGGLEGNGTSFRTATFNSSNNTWSFSAISLLEATNVMQDFIPGTYVHDRDHAVATADGSVVYVGANEDNQYYLGKIGTTVV